MSDPTVAKAIQLLGVLGGLLSVTVRALPGSPVVVSTVTDGCVRVTAIGELVAPPHALGMVTVMVRLVAVVARSLAGMATVSCVELT